MGTFAVNWLTFNGGFDVNSTSFTVSQAIGGTGSLTKLGAGTLYLTAANTYSGGTVLAAGTLNVSADAALGAAAGAATFIGNATLQAGTSGIALNSLRGIAIGTGVTATIDTQANGMSIAGAISGGGNLTKNSAGTLTLSGSNSYTGVTTLNAGTLLVGTGGTLSGSTAALKILGGGTLDLGGTTQTVGPTVIYGSSFLQDGTLSAASLTAYSGTISANLIGTGGFFLGGGTVPLSGNNTFSGGCGLNAGTLYVGNARALGTGVLTIDAVTIDNTSGSADHRARQHSRRRGRQLHLHRCQRGQRQHQSGQRHRDTHR